jgi:hypothetical protein
LKDGAKNNHSPEEVELIRDGPMVDMYASFVWVILWISVDLPSVGRASRSEKMPKVHLIQLLIDVSHRELVTLVGNL